ncbi:MAG: carboxylesterase family protein [Hyphomonadaceae bacterium]
MRKALSLLSALVLGACVSGTRDSDRAPRATVEGGIVQGAVENAVEVFRNIPFAAPPVGDLRWKAPQPVKAWEGVRDAVTVGTSCPQTMLPDNKPNGGGAYGPTSEDCLQLNVTAPVNAKKAPVLFWIHGGSHRVGNGWIYDGTSFAKNGIVVVSINYRLGALGYLSHPALGPNSGNYGLMDQIAALKWVKANIAQFGGDPNNVTVAGESAGGWSTMAVVATPSAKGLFTKAICESGGGWYPPLTLAEKEAQGIKLMESLGLPKTATAAELRALPADKVGTLGGDYAPFSDGVLMTETPSQALAAGRFPDVPLIIGWNSGEDTLMGPSPLPKATLKMIPPVARMIYTAEAKEGDEALARVIFTDSIFGAPARWVAAQASSGKPSYLYHFSYVPEALRATRTRAGHATELPYVFKSWGKAVGDIIAPDAPLADVMHACWASFIKTGVPQCGSTPWPAYTPASDQLMEFGIDTGVRTNFKKAQFTAQETVGLGALKLGK